MSPLISVVMPVRNAALTVRSAVQSVIDQTWTHWELIAVDDGSVDGTRELLHEMAALEPRIRVLCQDWTGISGALRAGCEHARGPWIARMDGDDIMLPERLARQVGYAMDHSGFGVISCLVEYGGMHPGYAAHVDWLNSLLTPEEIELRRFVESPVAHPSVMFRAELLGRHGGYREGEFPEDYELWLRWLAAGVRFGKVPEILLRWNDPPGRLSRNDSRYSVAAFYQIKCVHLAVWLRERVCPSRRIWLWGAGRITRRRFDALEEAGIRLEGFIDIDPAKAGHHRDGRPVVLADALPERSDSFVIVGVGNRGASGRIAAHLESRGWQEGVDFVLAA